MCVYVDVLSVLKRSCDIAMIRPDLVSRANSLLQVPIVDVATVCEIVNQNAGVGDQIMLRTPFLVERQQAIVRFVVLRVFE